MKNIEREKFVRKAPKKSIGSEYMKSTRKEYGEAYENIMKSADEENTRVDRIAKRNMEEIGCKTKKGCKGESEENQRRIKGISV